MKARFERRREESGTDVMRDVGVAPPMEVERLLAGWYQAGGDAEALRASVGEGV